MAKCIIFFCKRQWHWCSWQREKVGGFSSKTYKELAIFIIILWELELFYQVSAKCFEKTRFSKTCLLKTQKYPKCIRILPHFLIEIKFYFFVRVQDSCLSVSVTSLWWQVGVCVRLSEMFAMIHRERERERKWRIERKKIEFRMFETNNEDEVS